MLNVGMFYCSLTKKIMVLYKLTLFRHLGKRNTIKNNSVFI